MPPAAPVPSAPAASSPPQQQRKQPLRIGKRHDPHDDPPWPRPQTNTGPSQPPHAPAPPPTR